MKSFTSILILSFFLIASLSAQEGRKGQKEERIRSLRIAFITDKLQLTPEESAQFWPIYNEYETKRRKMRSDMKNAKKNSDISDSEADEMVNASLAIQEEQIKLKRVYYERMKKVIPSQKLVMLEKAEKEFRRKVVKEIKRRKQERRSN